MQDCRDTFLQYLSDNSGVTVHAVRQDANAPANALIQMNCLNVEFRNSSFSVFVSKQFVALDVTADNERDAVTTASAVALLLQTNASIPKNHYTVGASGAVTGSPVGSYIFWNPNAVNFKTIITDGTYFRFNLLLTLQHQLSNR